MAETRQQTRKKRLGEILIEERLISDLQLSTALGDQKQWGGRLGSILLRMKFITEEDLALALQQRLGVKWISLRHLKVPDTAIKAIPAETAKQFTVFPVGFDGKTLIVATTDPTDLMTMDTVSFTVGFNVKPVLSMESDIKWAISKYYDKSPEADILPTPPQRPPEERPQPHPMQMKVSMESTLDALIGLLIEKGVISRGDIARRIGEGKK